MSSVTEPILHWLSRNGDRLVTLEEIAEDTGLNRARVRDGVRRIRETFPQQMERKTAASFIWHSEAPKPDTEMLLLRVIRRKDGALLAIDEDTDVIYTVREVAF